MALLVGGVVALGGSSRPWIHTAAPGSETGGVATFAQALVTGSQAAPLVTAAALVALAAAGAVALSGRVTRFVALVLALLAGLAVVVPTVQVLSSPEEAAAQGLAESSGVVGAFDARGIDAATTAWPVVVLAAGVLVLLAALVGVARARRWDAVTRFESAATRPSDASSHSSSDVSTDPSKADPEPSPADDWDALTRDEDPTRERPGSGDRPG
jgi:uncharacterized membrane protein (TIGR02234 family)